LRSYIAVPSDGRSEGDPVSERFARASYFLLFDEEGTLQQVIENKAKEAGHGAGGRAVQELSRQGVSVVLAPRVGPKAQGALDAAGIKFSEVTLPITCERAVREYIKQRS
jgi:predicted Fe-Mo cluster-binding NifX family protein